MSSLSILMALYECNSPVTDHWWIPLTKASNVISVILHTKLLHCRILTGLLWPFPRPTDVCQSILTLTTRYHLATGKRGPLRLISWTPTSTSWYSGGYIQITWWWSRMHVFPTGWVGGGRNFFVCLNDMFCCTCDSSHRPILLLTENSRWWIIFVN